MARTSTSRRRERDTDPMDSLKPLIVLGLLGTIMYGATLYRERGSVDSFASFDQMGGAVPFGSHGQINKLLGVNRAQVA